MFVVKLGKLTLHYFNVRLDRSMSCSVSIPVIQRLKDILDILGEDEVTKVPAQHTLTQSVITSAAALLGAFLGELCQSLVITGFTATIILSLIFSKNH